MNRVLAIAQPGVAFFLCALLAVATTLGCRVEGGGNDDEDNDDDNYMEDDEQRGFDNVAACEDWLDAVSCGSYDFSTAVDCNLYEETLCDIADYFDCLTDNTSCDDTLGIPDTTGWASCSNLALCE